MHVVSGLVSAQPASPGNAANTPAAANAASAGVRNGEGDRAWAAVVALRQAPVASTAAPVAPSGPSAGVVVSPTIPSAPSAVAQSKARATARALAQRQAAAAAKDFYTRFPSHAQAPAARKVEALSGLAAITDDDKVHETAALKTAGDFRTNKAHPVSDRFEVAHAVERHVVGRKLGGKSWLSAPFESEALADRLHTEFGHLPEVYGNYLAVAQHTNCDHSRDVAQRLLQMPASDSIKAGARRVLDRWSLLRKPLDFSLTTAAGKATRLSAEAGKRTVVVFWDGVRSPAGPPGLYPFVKNAPPNTQWVYISLGAWTPPSPATKGNANTNAKAGPPAIKASVAPPGTYCVEPLGLRSPLAARLKISSLPFVCVLDDKKALNAFGRVDEIPALLAGINRLIEQ